MKIMFFKMSDFFQNVYILQAASTIAMRGEAEGGVEDRSLLFGG